MQENLLNQNKRENTIKNAEKYALRYFTDLQNHFSLTDSQIIKVLKNCLLKLKRNNTEKKWWHFF